MERYSGALRVARPVYNAFAALRRETKLPAPGDRIHAGYLACFAVADDALDVGRALLAVACQGARARGWQYAIAGLHERDPLAVLLRDFARIEAAGRLFVVSYPDGMADAAILDDRVPYPESRCL